MIYIDHFLTITSGYVWLNKMLKLFHLFLFNILKCATKFLKLHMWLTFVGYLIFQLISALLEEIKTAKKES